MQLILHLLEFQQGSHHYLQEQKVVKKEVGYLSLMQLLHPLLEFQQGSHHYLQEQKVEKDHLSWVQPTHHYPSLMQLLLL